MRGLRKRHIEMVLTSLVAGVLRSDQAALQCLSRESTARFLSAAQAHGVQCLAERVFRDPQLRAHIPPELDSALRAIVRCEQGVELVRKAELTRIVDVLCEARVPMLFLKGAALAYTHY